ncbi:MAG: hypothetical protein LC685_04810, partial [Actinobacteria bacterium]|nr:hypothetical protein [Actinomycetota bacterium]
MTRERAAFAALALLAVALWALAPTYPGIDSYYHLVWGRELAHGHAPTFDSYRAPTHHPLWVLAGALLSLSGEHGDRLLVLLTLLCFVVFVWGLWRLGTEVFGFWPGVAGAVFAGTSFAFLLYAVRGFLDVPFLALVAWAGALEAGVGERRRVPVMLLLAVAGLLRPEAWLLIGAYWLWCRGAADHRTRALLAAIGLAAPVVWIAVDAAATGDALFSFHSTGRLAEELAHTGGPGAVAANLLKFLAFSIRPPVLVLGLVGLVVALRRGGWRPIVVPLALLGGGTLAFAGTGLAGLSILPRYLVVPAAALCLFAGYALLGFAAMDKAAAGTAVLRRRWARAAGAVGLLGVFAAGALLV